MTLTGTPVATTSSEATPPSVAQLRPWGSWQVLDVGEGFKVKRLSVTPHSRLSLQTHRHRSEHWIVVAGVATCTVGRCTVVVGEGGRVDVPRGAVHRIANERDEELMVIELQLGSYTGEDDIVRIADDYGREQQIASQRGQR